MSIQDQFTGFIKSFIYPGIITALICCCEFILISENVHFLQSVGKSFVSACLIASCIAVSILFLSIHYRRNLAAMAFVAGLVFMQVFFSGFQAVKPQLSKQITAQDKALLSAFHEQAEALKQQINSYSAKFKTKKAELTKERSIILSELKSISDNAGKEQTGIEKHLSLMAIALTVFQRIALELIAILLCHILGRQFAPSLEISKIKPDSEPVKCKPEILQLEFQENRFAGLTPKDFVLSQYPDATCMKKGSNFRVYSDDTEKVLLSSGGNAPRAYLNAACLIERETPQESRRAC